MVEIPVKMYVVNLLKGLRDLVRPMAALPTKTKDDALRAMATALEDQEAAVLDANLQDTETVGKALAGESNKDRVKEAVDRVRLPPELIKDMITSLRRVADFPEPVGEMRDLHLEENGMQVCRMRVPIGLIAVISDLGPEVAVDTVALCLKSGNVSVLRLNPDWTRTNEVIFPALAKAAREAGVPSGGFAVVERGERDVALELMRQHTQLNAIIPRGGAGLRKAVQEHARVPVLGFDGGMCHLYVDAEADLPMAQKIVVNSKIQKPGALNAVDVLLVHKTTARNFLAGLIRLLLEEFKVQLIGCPKTMSLMGSHTLTGYLSIRAAVEGDWHRQYTAREMGLKIVESLDEAMEHIAKHGPSHTAGIVTKDYPSAMRFAREVDAGSVLVNTSTRLNDGREMSLGGDLGMSAMRIHTRGPIGLRDLTCEKYVVLGSGQLREPHPVPDAYSDAIMLKKGLG
jgi:glutamate-5-semialdehyde dehydrogenase